MYEFECDLEFVNTFDWHIDDKVIVLAGESSNL